MEYFQEKRLSTDFRISVHACPGRFVEQAFFDLRLIKDQDRVSSIEPMFSGLYSSGRPSQLISSWVDGDYLEAVSFPSSASLSLNEASLDVSLFNLLGGLVQPGGSLMVSYSLFSGESKIHRETKQVLGRGYPPVVAPLGFLIFQAGCGMGFKDWYYAEGGREGPQKLQGFKPINAELARRKAKSMIEELQQFKEDQSEIDELRITCNSRADYVTRQLQDIQRGLLAAAADAA